MSLFHYSAEWYSGLACCDIGLPSFFMRLEPSSNTSRRSFTHLDKQVSLKQAMFYQCWVLLHFIGGNGVRTHGWATNRVSLPKSARVIVFKHYKDPKTSLNSLPEWFFPKMWCTSSYLISRPLHHSHNWNLSVRWDNTAPNVCGLATLLLLSSRNFSEYDYAFSKCFLQQKLQLQSKNVVHAVIRSGGRKQYRDVVSSSYLLLLWRNPKYGGVMTVHHHSSFTKRSLCFVHHRSEYTACVYEVEV